MDVLEADLHSKLFWNLEARSAQRWITGFFTRVHTTCDVPPNAIFGPCELKHTSFYDSIAFIALKSIDRRTAPYILRVDISAPNTRSGGPMWLRLVQSARSGEEQNLEAYVKNGQLFFKALRAIQKEEELLVWYGKELSNLLLLKPLQIHSKGAGLYRCVNCDQRFGSEFPFLAHRRFICTLRQPNSLTKLGYDKPNTNHDNSDSVTAIKLGHPQNNPQDGKPTTDFHNLAREMENTGKKTGFSGVQSASALKRKRMEVEGDCSSLRIPMLKQEPMDRGYCDLSTIRQPCPVSCHMPTNPIRKAFTEDGPTRPQLSLKTSEIEVLTTNSQNQNDQYGSGRGVDQRHPKNKLSKYILRSAETSTDIPAGTSIFSNVSVPENRSVFSQSPGSVPLHHTIPLPDRTKSIIPKTQFHRPILVKGISKPRHPLYSPAALWTRPPDRHLVQVPSSPVLLAPSVPRLSPLCMPVQNWCAKCNVSFRLTSDLVQHMRSHHKRALDATVSGSRMKQQYKEKEDRLKCSICSEVFRQRHHLARHLTSHT